MDLSQLANLGEFIGGVAVLVTLVYLALQVRQGNMIERRNGDRAFAEQIDRAFFEPMRNPEQCCSCNVRRGVSRSWSTTRKRS